MLLKFSAFLFFITLDYALSLAQPIFKNPGIPASESFEIYELFDPIVGRVTTKVDVALHEQNGLKYYTARVNEGGLFLNEIKMNYNDLTTVWEKRTDLKTGKVVQSYRKTGDTIYFYNTDKGINKTFVTHETNIYSSLAYYISFRGFPFEVGKSVSFKSYIYQYGGVLNMNLVNMAKKTVTVKAGTFECYVLQLSVGGWQSLFATDKYYLYFTVASPHIFVMYQEKINGAWSADELMQYTKQ